MSATTCFLTPVRVLVTQRMEAAEKFMTLEDSCPPSKTASSLPPSLWTALLCSLPYTLNLPQDSAAFPSFVHSLCSDQHQPAVRGPGGRRPPTIQLSFKLQVAFFDSSQSGNGQREERRHAAKS
ncbi:hypothetical protein ATANTOWER_014213 [Ataeniobius toweri]|uniref:Uncharacterized protein n=1 Tax=Ataeniobius toweri TaxID=208326 RepID=A0ABU7BME9_9TELE|nr:hypothetical protein [Ataeniobius toweri]